MSDTLNSVRPNLDDAPTTEPSPAASSVKAKPVQTNQWFMQFLRRLHFYAGILVGPFILMAAATGALYAMTPTIENIAYSHELHVPASDTHISLTDQVVAANKYVGANSMPVAVRPAPENGDTTRVMYADKSLGKGESRAVFVNPANGEIRGDLTVYGTSGALPFRSWVSKLHSGALFGDFAEYYSELAASWLWIVAVAGLFMVFLAMRKSADKKKFVLPNNKLKGYLKTLSWHRAAGVWLALLMLFFSATGITWSQLAGKNVDNLFTAMSWKSPKVNTKLTTQDAAASSDAHAEHMGGMKHDGLMIMSSDFQQVLEAARTANIDGNRVEISIPKDTGYAWTVRELPEGLPYKADSAAVAPDTFKVVSTANFKDFPFVAKLTSWGIRAHMGLLFGLANQLLLLAFALGLMAMIIGGYRMWWQRRPKNSSRKMGVLPPRGAFRAMPLWSKILTVLVLAGICWFLPLVGYTLPAFVLVDVVLGLKARTGNETR